MKRLSAAKFVSSPMLTKAKQNSQPRMDLETLVDANTMLSSKPLLAKTENTSEASTKPRINRGKRRHISATPAERESPPASCSRYLTQYPATAKATTPIRMF